MGKEMNEKAEKDEVKHSFMISNQKMKKNLELSSKVKDCVKDKKDLNLSIDQVKGAVE